MRGPSTGQEENPGLNPALWPKAAAPAAPGLAEMCLGCVGVTVGTGHGVEGTPLQPGRGSCRRRKPDKGDTGCDLTSLVTGTN